MVFDKIFDKKACSEYTIYVNIVMRFKSFADSRESADGFFLLNAKEAFYERKKCKKVWIYV